MNPTPLNPDALDHLATVVLGCTIEEWNDHDDDEKRQVLAPYRRTIETYLAVAQPEVSSVEELDALPVGSVVRGGEYDLVGEKIRHSPYPPHWCTIGEEVEAYERDLLPARVLHRPEVKS